ncbi:hypothetical protein DEJ50_29950 [Streptomyces venezuelae]|uniref:Uncharacterized protein n=1 Tax=Streptomyces venezuelae TaxID=54571 RepID=A0A5P2DA49_STRVZ|nr:hypothetical protein [Streptomyces venezuelae]QES51440.1 hypothetical protein DEJ50_29950 [Streptomyces venezuelae]
MEFGFGGGFTVTRAKGKDSSRSFGLAVQCAPSGDLQGRDENDNFDDFYNKVVDPLCRVPAPVPPPGAPPLEKAMRAENIASNYELIKRLEPYVKTAATSASALATATRDALAAQLPELLPHSAEITDYLSRYFGLED